MLELPLDLACRGIDSANRAPKRLRVIVRKVRASIKSVSRLIGLRRSAENVALFARGDVKEFRLRIVSRRHPICGTNGARTIRHSGQSRRSLLALNGHAARVFRVAPGDLAVRSRRQKLPVAAIN